jgi:hypothetical protein
MAHIVVAESRFEVEVVPKRFLHPTWFKSVYVVMFRLGDESDEYVNCSLWWFRLISGMIVI